MANRKATESDKITGDKFETLIDETMNRDSRRKGKEAREREAASEQPELDEEDGLERDYGDIDHENDDQK